MHLLAFVYYIYTELIFFYGCFIFADVDFGLDVMDVTGELQLKVEDKIAFQPVGRNGASGCRLVGTMYPHKVNGEFHVAFGKVAVLPRTTGNKMTGNQKQVVGHTHRFSFAEMKWFDPSHIIDRLSFGYHPRKCIFPFLFISLNNNKEISTKIIFYCIFIIF